jgi:uncharacterized protein YbjT (DUF2867 family)
MKRILVTGAGGFIAGHLIPHLADAGAAVVAVSRRADLPFRHPAVTAARLPASQAEWAALLSGIDAVSISPASRIRAPILGITTGSTAP